MKINYKSPEQIWKLADTFRAQYAQDTIPPIDVVYIAEIDLALELVPTPQLFAKSGMDAALASDLHTVYVDEESYIKWEAGQNWIEKRLRFSVAH